MAVFDSIENYIMFIDDGTYNLGKFLKLNLSENIIETLFDNEVLNYYLSLKSKSEKLEIRLGDFDHAIGKDYCFIDGKKYSYEEIESMIKTLYKEIKSDFFDIKNKKYDKYFKL